MSSKWSYCAFPTGLRKAEGRDSDCRGEHLTGLLCRAAKYLSCPLALSLFEPHFSRIFPRVSSLPVYLPPRGSVSFIPSFCLLILASHSALMSHQVSPLE